MQKFAFKVFEYSYLNPLVHPNMEYDQRHYICQTYKTIRIVKAKPIFAEHDT
jgi:hypothetical protein